MKVDHNTPVPLILESLQSNLGWKLLEERILAVRNAYNQLLITKPANTPVEEIQRLIGVMEGLNRILRDPILLEREWQAAKKAEAKRIAANQQRAETYEQAE